MVHLCLVSITSVIDTNWKKDVAFFNLKILYMSIYNLDLVHMFLRGKIY